MSPCVSPLLMKQRERREALEQVTERDIDARHDRCVGGRFEKVREAAAGDELREDRELTGRRVALHPVRPGEPFILESGQPGDAVPDERFERRQLRLHVGALQHLARFAVERQRPSPQAIDVAG